jgi:hypothetical protein
MKSEKPLVNKKFLLEKYPGKGGWTYAVIPGKLRSKKTPFGWVKLKGFIDTYEVKNFRLMPMGDDRLFLPVKAAIRKKIGKEAGDWIKVVLYPDHDPQEIPEELLICLKDDPDLHKIFLSYSDSEQKMFSEWINEAKGDDTKVNRIAKTLDKISKRQKFHDK